MDTNDYSDRPGTDTDSDTVNQRVSEMSLDELAQVNDAVQQMCIRVSELEDALDLYRRIERERVMEFLLAHSQQSPENLAGMSLHELRDLAEDIKNDVRANEDREGEGETSSAKQERRAYH